MRLIRIAFTLGLAVTAARAETAQERGKRVVQDAVGALGGPRFNSVTAREEVGRAYSFYREQLSGFSVAKILTRYDSQDKGPDTLSVRTRQLFTKKFDFGVLFLRDAAYEMTFRGARPIAPERWERYRQSTLHDVFYILRMRLNEPGMIIESKGADVVENEPVEIVQFTDSLNQITTVFFHKSSKLPVRQTFERLDPKTRDRDQEITVYSKYREVDGVNWPFAIHRERNGEKVYEMFSESVRINPDVPDSEFQLPQGVHVLKQP